MLKIRIDKLDTLFARYVKLRANYECEYCGKRAKSQGMHCAHFIGRRYKNTRWITDNAACLCMACHNLMHDFSTIHNEFFTKRLGSDRVEQLEIIARTYAVPDKKKIEADLKEKIKLLEEV